mmetsp:Transcript_28358/g.73525  ORF Transcript_28358/g.73525 Transcript_28358/m.73525 type:complete len:300 (-) Transcript_28358:407-1306(-)
MPSRYRAGDTEATSAKAPQHAQFIKPRFVAVGGYVVGNGLFLAGDESAESAAPGTLGGLSGVGCVGVVLWALVHADVEPVHPQPGRRQPHRALTLLSYPRRRRGAHLRPEAPHLLRRRVANKGSEVRVRALRRDGARRRQQCVAAQVLEHRRGGAAPHTGGKVILEGARVGAGGGQAVAPAQDELEGPVVERGARQARRLPEERAKLRLLQRLQEQLREVGPAWPLPVLQCLAPADRSPLRREFGPSHDEGAVLDHLIAALHHSPAHQERPAARTRALHPLRGAGQSAATAAAALARPT